jgi:DNA-binding NtrC family response regulator
VLILGEPGTGRAAVARALAAQRGLGDAPFVTLDPIGARAILESGLLGAESKSATIYLPGVDLAGTDSLVALGGLLAGHVLLPVHLILSAGPDLPLLSEAGIFRRDLSDLLSAHSITLPPLRERGGDVMLLAEHFVAPLAQRAGVRAPGFPDPVRRALLSYPWPGNAEELRGEVTRAFLRRRGEAVELADLSAHVRGAADSGVQRTLAQAQEDHIQKVLASVGGHRGRAAEILRIDRKTLRERLGPKCPSGRPTE